MKNPSRRTINAVLLVILGIGIGLGASAIRMDELHQSADASAGSNLRRAEESAAGNATWSWTARSDGRCYAEDAR